MSPEVMEVASGLVLWIIAFFVIGVVIFQAIKFMSIARKAAPGVGMSQDDVKTALKTGLISSIGPSFGVAIVILALMSLLGSPFTLMRIGVVGSAATEAGGAEVAAKVFGVSLGGEGFTKQAFATVVWTLSLGGMGWLVVVSLFTKSLGKVEKTIKKRNPKVMASVSLAAMLGAFGYLAGEQMVEGISYAISGFVAVSIMVGIMGLAEKKNIQWLKEWALGISMIAGMAAGFISFSLI